jgi:hypothetical protein
MTAPGGRNKEIAVRLRLSATVETDKTRSKGKLELRGRARRAVRHVRDAIKSGGLTGAPSARPAPLLMSHDENRSS